LFGVESVARFCHELEQRLRDDRDAYTRADRGRLRELWSTASSACELLGNATRTNDVEIGADEYLSLVRALEAQVDHRRLLSVVATWRYERASLRLARAAEQLRALGQRLGKGDVNVQYEVVPSTLRLSHRRWSPFWAAFAHVLRNTMDHGVESPAERAAAHKPRSAQITLSLRVTAEGLEFVVADDGRGIDWAAIRTRAAYMGLPHATEADLEEAIYADGLSSRAVVTDVSGRGIGMGAVREAVRSLGGRIRIATELGRGTRFQFSFPRVTLPLTSSHSPAYVSAAKWSSPEMQSSIIDHEER
jgi:chemotaxis protein histidine kinase CheA